MGEVNDTNGHEEVIVIGGHHLPASSFGLAGMLLLVGGDKKQHPVVFDGELPNRKCRIHQTADASATMFDVPASQLVVPLCFENITYWDSKFIEAKQMLDSTLATLGSDCLTVQDIYEFEQQRDYHVAIFFSFLLSKDAQGALIIGFTFFLFSFFFFTNRLNKWKCLNSIQEIVDHFKPYLTTKIQSIKRKYKASIHTMKTSKRGLSMFL